MAEALVWHLIRDNNSFLVKRGQTKRDGSVQFSTEAGNLLGVHSFKHSGIANRESIDISAATKVVNDKIHHIVQLTKKSAKDFNKPSKAVETSKIKNFAGLRTAIAGYRTDVAAAAALRYKKLYKGTSAKKGQRKTKASITRGRH